MLKEIICTAYAIGAIWNPTYIGNSAVYSTSVESTSGGHSTIYVVDNNCDGTTDYVFANISNLVKNIDKLYE